MASAYDQALGISHLNFSLLNSYLGLISSSQKLQGIVSSVLLLFVF